MIVMIILMLLPVLAIPVFWLMSLGQALAVYLVCCLASGMTYWIMHTNMKRPVRTGKESLVGMEARVVSKSAPDVLAPYQVRIQGEIWSASSQDSLEVGDTAVVSAVEGNKLVIRLRERTRGGT